MRPVESFKQSIGAAAYEEAGIGPDEVSLAEVYDLSITADQGLFGHGSSVLLSI